MTAASSRWIILAALWAPLFAGVCIGQEHNDVVAQWKFDEGAGNVATNAVTGHADAILNHHSWVKGVSGSALKFDGFTTVIEPAAEDVPKLGPQFSIEAWVVVLSYPWNWVAIVDQERDQRSGYYFGIDSEGRLGLRLAVWGNWEECVSEARLPLNKWIHVVGTYDSSTGVSLFVNGELAGKLPVIGSMTSADKTDMRIGRNFKDLPPTALVRPKAAFPALYSFDGIIDEITIHNRALAPDEVSNAYRQSAPTTDPEVEARKWPVLPSLKRFGAAYTQLKLYPEWDALWRTTGDEDVVVSFENLPFHYVFWRGANFGPSLVTENGIWIGDQSFEAGTKVGTAEHMNDKHNSLSHVSIVENTDARVVLHWRYGLADVLGSISNIDPVTGWGDWADEFFYIYPDGSAVRYGVIQGSDDHYSFTEPTLLLQPGKKPEDFISLQAVTVANPAGETHTYSWDPVSPPFPFPNLPENTNIAVVNLKSVYKPFYLYTPGTELGPYGWPPELRNEYSHFPVWNHWPVNQIPSDGRYALFPDHFASAAVMSPDPKMAPVEGPQKGQKAYFIFGLTAQPVASLVQFDRSWLNPPHASVSGNQYNIVYEPSQKAYMLSPKNQAARKSRGLQIFAEANEDSPLVNPAFVVEGWDSVNVQVQMNGKSIPSSSFHAGVVETFEGARLVLWISSESIKPVQITISRL